MSSFKKISAGMALALACAATAAQAAPTLTIVLDYAGTFNSDFSQFEMKDLTNPAFSGPDWFHQIDVKFQLSDLDADMDFGGLSINFDSFGTGFSDPGFGWAPPTAQEQVQLRTVPTAQFANLFTQNADSGTPGDLKAVLVQADSKVAFRGQPGEAGRPTGNANSQGYPTFIGSLFVNWNGGPAVFDASPAAGASLNLFLANSDVAGKGATAFAPTNPDDSFPDYVFVSDGVQFGAAGPVPTFKALASNLPASDPNLPDVAFPFTGDLLQYQPPVPVGGDKAEFQFPDVAVTPDGSLYAIFWLTGDEAGIAAVKAAFPDEPGTPGDPFELVGPGSMFDSLMRAYPGANLILQFDGQAGVLDGGSLGVDFSGNGVTIAQFAAVPEPASLLALGGLSFLGLTIGRRRR